MLRLPRRRAQKTLSTSGGYSRLTAWGFHRDLRLSGGPSRDNRRATPPRFSGATSDRHRGLGYAQHPLHGQTGLEFAPWCCMPWELECRGKLNSDPSLGPPGNRRLDTEGVSVASCSHGSGCGDQCQHPVHVIGIDTE